MAEPSDETPLEYRPPRAADPAAVRFERNGWIGLAITLAVCTICAVVFLGRR